MTNKSSAPLKIGSRVGVMYNEEYERIELPSDKGYHEKVTPCYGKIIGLVDQERVNIKWDDYSPITQTCLYHSELLSEKELRSVRSTMEKEWDKKLSSFQKQMASITTEIVNASKLVKNIPDAKLYDVVHSIYSALDRCGWNSSSFQC